MKKRFLVVAAMICSSTLLAQQDTTVLDEAIVTANKFEQKQSQTGKVISVITKEQIARSSGKTVAQLLNEQAGLTINGAYNALGSDQTIFMRGASSGRTLILLDGIPVNDPSMLNNEFDLNLFSINDVERIEICRGAQSTLYGSDAIAGAINIITVKKDIDKAVNAKATISFGNLNTVRNNVQLYGKLGKLTYTSRFAKLSTDGFSAANDNVGNRNFDRDGYNGNVINTGVQYQLLPSLSVRGFIQHSQYKADIDAGVFADEKDYGIRNKNLSSGAGFQFKKGIVSVTGNYQYGELSRRYFNDSFYVRPGGTKFESNNYNGRTQYAELYANIAPFNWLTILVGGDHRWSYMRQKYFAISGWGTTDSPVFDSSLHQHSLYGSLIFHAWNKRLNIEIGGRYNDHSRYGSNTTYTINPSYVITNGLRVFGSIATGFKAPSIYQLFDVYSGNRELNPEKSTNYEIGVQQTHRIVSSRVVYFRRDIKNGIDYNNVTYQYFNYVRQEVSGLEIELALKPTTQLSLTANYTYITGEEETQSRKDFSDANYDYLLRRPKHQLNVQLGYQFTPALFASVSGKSISGRYDIGGYMADDVWLDKYFLLGAYAEYQWKKEAKFFLDLQNITDKKFFDRRGYNAIPFMVSGGVTIQL